MDTAGKPDPGAMSTLSMENWDKSAAELSVSAGSRTVAAAAPEGVASPRGAGQPSLFRIDEHEMFVAQDEDYFVVL